MWEPRRLTTLCTFTACYRDNFTFFLIELIYPHSSVCKNGSCHCLASFSWPAHGTSLKENIRRSWIKHVKTKELNAVIPTQQLLSSPTADAIPLAAQRFQVATILYRLRIWHVFIERICFQVTQHATKILTPGCVCDTLPEEARAHTHAIWTHLSCFSHLQFKTGFLTTSFEVPCDC
jgi:hypothetical protein